jgi:hypothetical protein
MPTATKSTSSDGPGAFERVTKLIPSGPGDAVDRVIKLNKRGVATGKRVGTVYLDGNRKTAGAAISGVRETSGQPLETVRTLVKAQANVASEFVKTYTAVGREVLAA